MEGGGIGVLQTDRVMKENLKPTFFSILTLHGIFFLVGVVGKCIKIYSMMEEIVKLQNLEWQF